MFCLLLIANYIAKKEGFYIALEGGMCRRPWVVKDVKVEPLYHTPFFDQFDE